MAASQWPQQHQQIQQQAQHYQQPQQYPQGQQYQPTQQYQYSPQYQQNQQYQVQQYPQQLQSYPVQQHPHNQQYQGHYYQQPQQGQPIQHYQQAQQAPFVAQKYSQAQPNQSAQQYSQQQSQQSQQPQQSQPAHDGYQNQYAPYQYSSQQYAPQQQVPASQQGPPVHPSPTLPVTAQHLGKPPYGGYQQAPQTQRNPAQGPNPARTTSQSCFNCGNSGHFAMDCPEPIRAIPAGKANPQAFLNPLRRPKNGGPGVTSPQYTQFSSHAQASPKGYSPPPHGQTGFPQHPQYHQEHNSTTSFTEYPPAQAQYYQQWQQYYQSQQAYQQGNNQQGSPYHQQPYATPHTQPLGYACGPQTPTQSSIQYTGATQTYEAPTGASPIQFNHESSGNGTMTQLNQREQSMTSNKSHPSPSSPQKFGTLDFDVEEDDLNSLDIPDLPQTTLQFVNASRQPINLITYPLPGNSVVADALAPFPSPAPQEEGCCKSKYHFNASPEAYLEHFKNSKYWDKEHADDVIFSDLPADGKVILLEEVLAKIRERRARLESGHASITSSRSQSQMVPLNQDSFDVKSTLDRMERELAETKAKLQAKLGKGRSKNSVHASTPQPVTLENSLPREREMKVAYESPPPSATSEKFIKSEQDTEDVLAALGVTGAPKPVTVTRWPNQYAKKGSPNDMQSSRSSSSPRADINGRDQHELHSKRGQATAGCHGSGSHPNNQHSWPPPPPPPMPSRRQSYPERTDGSPVSAGFANVNPFGSSTNGVDHGNGHGNGPFSSPTDGQAVSPMETRSEKSISRKRHRDSSSDEDDTPKRRQEDDFTPKLKKRQPKVAEAYSRRW